MKSSPTDDNPARRTLLADASRSVGKTWAKGWFDELHREGRPVTGGWPGTMSEARGRARAHVEALFNRRSLPPVTHNELAEAARITYDHAKALWLVGRINDEGVA